MTWLAVIGIIALLWLAAEVLIVACFHVTRRDEPLPPPWLAHGTTRRPCTRHRARRGTWKDTCRR